MERSILENLVEEGKSSYEISNITSLGQTTIRYWLKKHGLKTKWDQFHKKERFGTKQICKKHGLTEFSTGKKQRCRKCLVEAVQKRREKVKEEGVKYLGGKCVRCGYNKCIGALEFHHLDPQKKEFSISYKGYTRAWKEVKKELDKCALLCSNCHRELHSGLFGLP